MKRTQSQKTITHNNKNQPSSSRTNTVIQIRQDQREFIASLKRGNETNIGAIDKLIECWKTNNHNS